MLKASKQRLRQALIKTSQHHEYIQAQNPHLADLRQALPALSNTSHPYQQKMAEKKQHDGAGAIIITSRFRSGSTLLWNLFRQTGLCTAYYEPFNERRWFDSATRGQGVDSTHRGVANYWQEYQDLPELGNWYNEDWIRHQLLMGEQAVNNPMQAFIQHLIEQAPLRPVLQFNRIDFRLPWLRKQFPKAHFVHLYRHPRDQWCSFLTDTGLMNKDRVQHNYQDAFYLNSWCRDLAKHYPLLDEQQTPHPYQRFYYLWKLSYLFGSQYCHHSLGFEALNLQPEQQLHTLFEAVELTDAPIEKLTAIFQAPKAERWRDYAGDDWFSPLEQECEEKLAKMLGEQEQQP